MWICGACARCLIKQNNNMKHIRYRFNIDIPTHLGIVILMVVSFFVAWFTINTGEKIVSNMPDSNIYDSQKAAQKIINGKVR